MYCVLVDYFSDIIILHYLIRSDIISMKCFNKTFNFQNVVMYIFSTFSSLIFIVVADIIFNDINRLNDMSIFFAPKKSI